MNERSATLSSWMEPVGLAISACGGQGSFLVSLGTYRPDLVRALAHSLDFAFVDFRAEYMAPLGAGASGVPLERINEVATNPMGRAGIVIHNVEGLLSTRGTDVRRAWLADLISFTSRHAVVVPLALYCGDAPSPNPRHVEIDPAVLPEEKLLMRLASR
ncbi:MAG: hypothetical protein KDJ47_09405 [Hyphomicrobiaceae bacterium]|nr:hypothetical protein [Hyphomicrobiaceae bacterium]